MTDALRALQLLSRVLACEACCPVERAEIAAFLESGPAVERCPACGFYRFADSPCPCTDEAADVDEMKARVRADFARLPPPAGVSARPHRAIR